MTLTTPFGDPSGPYVTGTLRGRRVAFLARHGAGHRLLPSELNFRANIFGMKLLGVEIILSASAVGSLKEEYEPLDIVIPDQFFDRTAGRDRARSSATGWPRTSGSRIPSAASPASPTMRPWHAGARPCTRAAPTCAWKARSSRPCAESKLYRSWGMDIIGMTNLQEAKLAREAEICYATIALVTDYDCWHPDHDSVTVDMVIANLMQNAKMAQEIIAGAVGTAAVRPHVRVRRRA